MPKKRTTQAAPPPAAQQLPAGLEELPPDGQVPDGFTVQYHPGLGRQVMVATTPSPDVHSAAGDGPAEEEG